MNHNRVKLRVAAGVIALWGVVAVVWGAQNSLGASLQGNPSPLGPAIQTALIQSLPWIPATLAVIWLAVRFPLTRTTWKRRIWIHLAALPAVTFAVNLLVVLGFWTAGGSFQGPVALVRAGLLWTTLRLHVAALIYAAVAGATQALLYYRETRARELRFARLEGQLARARLQALNAQIRPHFLFNTLHTIGQLWRSGRSTDADAMLDHLGALFQTVQSTATAAEVPMDEELRMVRRYLAIEETRFQDRLGVTVDADDAATACLVPPLILQPLVENSIRHGISAAADAGRVVVRAEVRTGSNGDRLVLEVEDDGPGMADHGRAPRSAAQGSGMGLANTRERLAQLYGADHAMDIEAPAGGGTRVRIDVPARRAEGERRVGDAPVITGAADDASGERSGLG